MIKFNILSISRFPFVAGFDIHVTCSEALTTPFKRNHRNNSLYVIQLITDKVFLDQCIVVLRVESLFLLLYTMSKHYMNHPSDIYHWHITFAFDVFLTNINEKLLTTEVLIKINLFCRYPIPFTYFFLPAKCCHKIVNKFRSRIKMYGSLTRTRAIGGKRFTLLRRSLHNVIQMKYI